jgi:ABC-type branched-subunit amino acid transport system substrate-binding protein
VVSVSFAPVLSGSLRTHDKETHMNALALRRAASGLVVVATLSLAAACGSSSSGSSASGKGDILIGTTIPTTGVGAGTCLPIAKGAEAWLDQVNASGGVDGRKIKDDVEDDAYNASEATANARVFAKDKDMVAVFNGCSGLTTSAAIPILEAAGMPYLFSWASVPNLDGYKHTFTLLPSYSATMGPFVTTAMGKSGPGSVYVIAQNIPGVQDSVSAIKSAAVAAGGSFLGSDLIDANQTDLTSIALKVKQAAPDYVVTITDSNDSARMITTLSKQSAMPKKLVLASNSVPSAAFLQGLGSTPIDGKVLAVSVPPAPTDAAAKSCVDAIKKYTPDVTPDVQSLTGCSSAQVLVKLLQDAGPDITRDSIVKAITSWSEVKASDVLAPVTFSQSRHQGISTMNVVGFQGGQIVPEYTFKVGSE